MSSCCPCHYAQGCSSLTLTPSSQSALLEEQKSVMHKCGEERRRLAAEWAEFFEQQKLSKERAEREAERAMQVDTQREGTFVSLVKVGPRAASPAPSLPSPHCLLLHPDASALQRAQQQHRS